MSQDMEAQTPICSLPHSGGRLSPQNPILSARTHTYVDAAKAQQEGRGLRTACTSGRETSGLRKRKYRRGQRREVAEATKTGTLSDWMSNPLTL